MCFLKKVEYGGDGTIQPCNGECQMMSYHFPHHKQPLQPWTHQTMSYGFMPNWQNLMTQLSIDFTNLVRRLSCNNEAIMGFVQKLEHNQRLLTKAEEEIDQTITTNHGLSLETITLATHTELNQIPFFSEDPLITRIFGHKEYKYNLKLKHDFPEVIYKERNLNLTVRLCNPDERPIFNANLIHLCVGVCTSQGKWIIDEEGDLFIKGKTQIDLYHGEAEFRKIYPRDVSRHFADGVINIIIYPKPSLVNFTGEVSKYERLVDCSLIEPLIIRDVVVKAKKKTNK